MGRDRLRVTHDDPPRPLVGRSLWPRAAYLNRPVFAKVRSPYFGLDLPDRALLSADLRDPRELPLTVTEAELQAEAAGVFDADLLLVGRLARKTEPRVEQKMSQVELVTAGEQKVRSDA